ncbi:MAG: hypothetical protein NTX50_04675 [Candidatus Sumerlaeota bacterium]|nr:hypothetical protein [Candidatus Sumerlaeota bacterium]
MTDEIIREVRAIREALAAQFNYDVDKIFAHLQKRERMSKRRVVNLAERKKHLRKCNA